MSLMLLVLLMPFDVKVLKPFELSEVPVLLMLRI